MHAAPSSDPPIWIIWKDGAEYGPYPAQDVRSFWSLGSVLAEDQIRSAHGGPWQPMDQWMVQARTRSVPLPVEVRPAEPEDAEPPPPIGTPFLWIALTWLFSLASGFLAWWFHGLSLWFGGVLALALYCAWRAHARSVGGSIYSIPLVVLWACLMIHAEAAGWQLPSIEGLRTYLESLRQNHLSS